MMIYYYEILQKVFARLNNLLSKVQYFVKLRYSIKTTGHQDGFNVYGYFSKIVGQGEIARLYIDYLDCNNIDFSLVDFFNINHKSITPLEHSMYSRFYQNNLAYKNNLFFIDLIALKRFKKLFPSFFDNKYNAVVFWWEFESGFDDRIDILNEFDEVYVFSDFIKNILENTEFKKFKVTKINLPFLKNWHIESDPDYIRKKYNIGNKFCFFFNFDYRSCYQRKNPEAILKAFYEEFSDEENALFVLKTNNSEADRKNELLFDSLVAEYGLNERVIIIKESLTRNGFMTLLNSMDSYISLHRGEGLGLGILEAFSLNKPAIATNYGGNTEYMQNELSYPVKYKLVSAEDHKVYKSVKLWAEPDIEDAKRCMREVFDKYKRLDKEQVVLLNL